MNLLVDLCSMDSLNPLWNVVGIIIKAIWIGVPILMIVIGSIDLGKAVIASKEEEVKKAKKNFITRLIYAVLVFAVVWIVTVLLNFVSGIGLNDADTTGWKTCWDKIMKN